MTQRLSRFESVAHSCIIMVMMRILDRGNMIIGISLSLKIRVISC